MTHPLYLLAAVANNRVIGCDNKMPWHLPEDLKHFKQLTLGHIVIMGRKTYESIGKPLPERINIVITRQPMFSTTDTIIVTSIEGALQACAPYPDKKCFVIGGSEIYQQTLAMSQRLYLTEIQKDFVGNRYFPEFDRSQWSETAREIHHQNTANGLEYHFVILDRKNQSQPYRKSMMKAVYFDKGGPSDVLHYSDMATPSKCGENQALVRIKAIGINPIDCKLRTAPERFPVTFPVIPGCDGAGIVEAVGNKVSNVKLGDEIYFSQPGFKGRQGTYAEYTLVDASLLALKPRTLSFEEAAAAPLVFITAWEALHDRARIARDQIVLIHAGAGGVGHAAIQLAKQAGARVITTVSNEEKAAFVKQLGADFIINYRTQDVIVEVMRCTEGNGVDIAFDTVGSAVLQSCFQCVKPYGDVVTILQATADIDWSEARKRNVRFSHELMLSPILLELEQAKQHQGEILKQCAAMFDDNKLTVSIARTFPLSEAAIAQYFLEQNHPIGKLVLLVQQ